MVRSAQIHEAFEQGKGIFCLAPVFVPRQFNKAGRRLSLHPDDYYAFGTHRGAIKERWFSSVVPAMNGPFARADEGMSFIAPSVRIEDIFLVIDNVDELGQDLIGADLWERYTTWPMYSKFSDVVRIHLSCWKTSSHRCVIGVCDTINFFTTYHSPKQQIWEAM